MTAQELIYKAIKGYDDYEGRSKYGLEDLDDVTDVITTCVRNQIGIKPIIYTYETDGTETVEDDYKQIPLPEDLTEDDQILAVDIGGYYSKTLVDTDLILLVPENYSGTVVVTYMPKVTAFTSLTQVIPISDDAANTVAKWMLAEALALRHRPSFAEKMEKKARMAWANWKPRDYVFTEVQDTYGF